MLICVNKLILNIERKNLLMINLSKRTLIHVAEINDIPIKTDSPEVLFKKFERWMEEENLAENTQKAYLCTITNYYQNKNKISKSYLNAYRNYLIENYKPATANQRIQAINKFLTFLKKTNLKLKGVKVQQKPFVDNVISKADYNFFVKKLKKDQHMTMYFIVKFMTCSGARISEALKIKYENVKEGKMNIYSKGGKLRIIYFPDKLAKECLLYLESINRTTGYIFLNKNGVTITANGVSKQLKKYGKKYGLDINTIYPHSFRHRFALNFLEKKNDLTLLADLLGHSNLQTTMVYTRMTSAMQAKLINEIVTW